MNFFLRFFLLLFLFSFLFLFPFSSLAWTGKVVGVADGDTIKVLHNSEAVRLRLYGIDTPEKRQAFGNRAKKYTNRMVRKKSVQIDPITMDRYGRTVAQVSVNGVSLNEALIRAGYAWVYRKYCRLDICDDWYREEHQARQAGKGLWRDHDPTPPWVWRRAKRSRKK